MRFAAFVLAVAAVSFYLGLQTGRSSPPTPNKRVNVDAAQASTPAPPPVCAVSIDPAVLRAEIARALGPAAALASNQVAEQAPAPAPADPGPAPSPEQVAAYDRGQTLFERVLRQGTMSIAESRELRAALVNMDETSRLETTRRLIQSMNQDKLKVEAHELPF